MHTHNLTSAENINVQRPIRHKITQFLGVVLKKLNRIQQSQLSLLLHPFNGLFDPGQPVKPAPER